MCFSKPKIKQPAPTPPPVNTQSAEVQQQGTRAAANTKRQRSIFAGESNDPLSQKKTLG
jgi:hypothetical protein